MKRAGCSCNLEDKSEVVAFDPEASFTVKNHWSLAPGNSHSGLAIDPEEPPPVLCLQQ